MEEVKRAPRRAHSAEFRSQVLAKCAQPGVSVAAVAMAHGLNANLVRKWKQAAGGGSTSRMLAQGNKGLGEFVALAMPVQSVVASPADIRIELRRGVMTMAITWPVASASDCAAWMRELLR